MEKLSKKVVLVALACALACCVPFARPAWLWAQTRWYVSRLDASDPGAFGRAYEALARDLHPDVLPLLCAEAERAHDRGDKAVYFQLVRAIHARCGIPFAPEDTRLPGPEDLRRMAREAREAKP